MDSDAKRVVLALVISVAVLFAWTTFVMPPEPKQAPAPTAAPAQTAQAPAAAPAPAAMPAPAPAPQVMPAYQDVVVETPLMRATFSTRGGALRKVVLKDYYAKPGQQGGEMVLLDLAESEPYALGLALVKLDPHLAQRPFQASAQRLEVTAAGQSISFSAESAGVEVVKTYTFRPDSHAFQLNVSLQNKNAGRIELTPELILAEHVSKMHANSYAFTGSQVVAGGSLEELDHGDLEDSPVVAGPIDCLTLSIPYFMGAVAPESWPAVAQGKPSARGWADAKLMTATLVSPLLPMDAGQSLDLKFLVYYGPKELHVLEPLGHSLAMAVDFGWFDVIAKPMLAGLNFFHDYVGNYGVAIIIITILIKLLFWPLQNKSYESMKKMQKLQPQIVKIREKYKDDKQEMNQQVMQLYKTYKVNPLGGCLPMLAQVPVFIAFYKVLGSSIELRHAPFWLWINDLSAPDRLPIGFEIPFVGDGIPVLTLLMGASMFITQKMSPATGDPTQQKMMMLMPVIFTVMFINFPSGLVLYWFVQNLLGIGQQWLVNRRKD